MLRRILSLLRRVGDNLVSPPYYTTEEVFTSLNLVLALLLAAALACPQQIVVVKKKAGGPTYLVNEGFEGTGAPTDWSSSGTVDWDEATVYHDGSQALQCDSSSADAYAISPAFAGATDTYGEFWFYNDHIPSNDADILRLMDGTTTVATIRQRSTGVLRAAAGASLATTTLSIGEDAWIRIWWHYTQGTGTNATLRIWWATTDTHPGNGSANYYAAATSGTSTAQITGIRPYSDFVTGTNGSRYYDGIVVDDAILW